MTGEKIDKALLQMPDVPSEDTAMWWQILRNGHVAYEVKGKFGDQKTGKIPFLEQAPGDYKNLGTLPETGKKCR